ncbi:MAG TPA: hypothetical protein VN578_16480 [Candidatus Binatia bacterium]|nr:hypothetical protein [Candidatus Binatia bacterium]
MGHDTRGFVAGSSLASGVGPGKGGTDQRGPGLIGLIGLIELKELQRLHGYKGYMVAWLHRQKGLKGLKGLIELKQLHGLLEARLHTAVVRRAGQSQQNFIWLTQFRLVMVSV